MTKSLSLLTAVLFLTGCSNMGNHTQTQYIFKTENVTNKEAQAVKVEACEKYTPLPVYLPPEIPLDKLRQATHEGEREVIIELTKYIKEIRESVVKRKKDERIHYENYLKTCPAEAKMIIDRDSL